MGNMIKGEGDKKQYIQLEIDKELKNGKGFYMSKSINLHEKKSM